MKLSIVTAMCGAPDITRQWLHETVGRCAEAPDLVIVSNGSTEQEVDEVRAEARVVWERWGGEEGMVAIGEFPEPLGSTKPLNIGIRMAVGDVVACLHNDLMVKQSGWDQEILRFFENRSDAGVVGFHGSKALGDDLIYQTPYEKSQLARGWSYSNMEDAEAHGRRWASYTEVATLDGMALIARRDDLLAMGGFDESLKHHMYDHDLCLRFIRAGFRNFMYPIVVRHVSGQTANMPRYNEHMKSIGYSDGDASVHDESHRLFYDKWRGTGMLPARR